MPKKFSGENSKAVAARARKTIIQEEQNRKKEKEKEDAYWRDDDKLVQKKLQRKEQQEKKRTEQLQKKAEIRDLLEKESAKLITPSKQSASKVTKLQILEEAERRNAAATKKKEPLILNNKPIEENVNRIQAEQLEARSVTEAISILNMKDTDVDQFSKKKVKAIFAAFEAAHFPRIKAENPSLRLSQLKEMLQKEWMRSKENPFNQH